MAGSRVFRHILSAAIAAALLLPLTAVVQTQGTSTLTVRPNAYDTFAASRATNAVHHAMPANTRAGNAARPKDVSNLHPNAKPAIVGGVGSGPRYPADLQYVGGTVVGSTQQYLIYVNLASSASCHTVATCWGNPKTFLKDLGNSDFIHVVDQYVGERASGRYTVSDSVINVNYTGGSSTFTDDDMLAIVHGVITSLSLSSGDGSLFHVFLTPGQSECFDNTFSVCYSPDNPSAWFFCAYHGSADFTDVGHVLYSVEPFQNVAGCASRPGTPNGQLADSTNSVLSHEVIETITDPDGTGWWNVLDNGLYGQEIADECSFIAFDAEGNFVGFDPSNVSLNGNRYVIQPEYDNSSHACVANSHGPGKGH